jgi:hypothetical protein
MLDSFTVMHKGGAVLWEKALSSIKGNPVNDLIRTVLLEERSGETNARIDMHLLKWALVNEFDLIFVVCTNLSRVSYIALAMYCCSIPDVKLYFPVFHRWSIHKLHL